MANSRLHLVAILLAWGTFGYSSADRNTVTHHAWFEVTVMSRIGSVEWKGKFVVALFQEAAPMTVMNFVALTKGYRHQKTKLWYKNSPIHRIVPDFVIQLGDITKGDGTGGRSIFGERFDDEEFILSHRSAGWVAMANHGPDTNGSQFYITLSKARWLDNKHVVFGKVVKGMDMIEKLGELPTDPRTASPRGKVFISNCGVEALKEKYEMTEEQMNFDGDLQK